MMDKIKSFFGYIIGGLGLVIGVLMYYISSQNKKYAALQARVALAETREEAVKLEIEINELAKKAGDNKKELDELEKTMVQLERKKKSIAVKEGARTEKEILYYWNEE